LGQRHEICIPRYGRSLQLATFADILNKIPAYQMQVIPTSTQICWICAGRLNMSASIPASILKAARMLTTIPPLAASSPPWDLRSYGRPSYLRNDCRNAFSSVNFCSLRMWPSHLRNDCRKTIDLVNFCSLMIWPSWRYEGRPSFTNDSPREA
jgi:hypothetical protein